MWGGGDIPSQGAEIRGLSHGPTFQRCGDAAHLIEACVPLTADHLEREQEEAQLGLKIPLLAGRAASGGPACGKHPEATIMMMSFWSLHVNSFIHFSLTGISYTKRLVGRRWELG